MALATFEVRTTHKSELVDITKRVKSAVRSGGGGSGMGFVFFPPTTAGITLQENTDPDVRADVLLALANAIPLNAIKGSYKHGEGNSDAHVKAGLVGSSQAIPLEKGKLMLGTWQAIYLCEFDGPRSRKVHVQVLES